MQTNETGFRTVSLLIFILDRSFWRIPNKHSSQAYAQEGRG
jgi:hypothetical protein